jgi:hypothetical protein
MKILTLLLTLSFFYYTVNAQTYTCGGASQLYWDWRPDLASNCYEFTYINYVDAKTISPYHDYKIGIAYWNDCNYGNSYIMDTNCSHLNNPLHDTLYRATSFYGQMDTLCGFDLPYNAGTHLNFAERTSPVRSKLVYKGLVYLPEKCNRWYFSPVRNFVGYGVDQYYAFNGTGYEWPSFIFPIPLHTNTKSNLDSIVYVDYFKSLDSILFRYFKMPFMCSFDNTVFQNNHSSRFVTQVPYYFPVGKSIEYNAGNYDPDHDSIVLSIPDTIQSGYGYDTKTYYSYFGIGFCPRDSLGNPQTKLMCNNHFFAPLPGQSGFNPLRYNAQNNPFDTDSTFHMVDSTGRVTFTAKSAMHPVLYTKATEYRNGKFLSENFTISQFTLINENREPSYMRIDTQSVQSALLNHQGTLMSCTGLPIHFDAYVKLPIIGGNLIVTTTADSTLPGNGACTVTGVHTDSVHLKFSWTPPADARGLYNVYVSAKDSNCNPPYHHYLQVYTWSFYIDSCLSPLSVPAVQSPNDFVLYPNPTFGSFTIKAVREFNSVSVYNVLAQEVMKKKLPSTRSATLQIHDLPKGLYMVIVDGKYGRKLMIEK